MKDISQNQNAGTLKIKVPFIFCNGNIDLLLHYVEGKAALGETPKSILIWTFHSFTTFK